jgi:hypothetical protein
LKFFNLRELLITETELKDIASAAKTGFSIPRAAKGIPTTLYMKAQNKFCLIIRIVFFES